MSRAASRLARGLAVVTLLAAPAAVAQQADPSAAERLYEEGSKRLAAGDLAHACPMLDESQRIDPTAGGALAVALCREREGKLASAVTAYDAAARLARGAGDAERASAAEARAVALRPRVPRVDIVIAPALRSRGPFVIVLDGEVVGSVVATSTRLELDAGSHRVEARAGDLVSETATFEARDGAIAPVEIVAREAEQTPLRPPAVHAPASSPPSAPPPSDSTWTTTRILGIGAIGAGAIGLGIGTAFAIAGSGDADELERLGYDGAAGTCRADLALCQSSYDAASTAADASTALWIAGGALVGLGVTLFAMSASDDATAASLRVTPAGVRFAGRYGSP